jgi:tetratricopeptide (TPR) repeat protein
MEGTRIGAYKVESELGSGAMGTVHRARVAGEAPGLDAGQLVAIKLLHPHLLSQPGFFKRFMREAKVGRQVEHENVVRTFDVDALEVEGKTAHFLVMEYVEGRTLRAMLDDLGTVPEALLGEIARQVAAGLSAIHEVGAVHRDLKPENILVTDDHQVRIMDLGVARLVEESVALTRKGEFAGSLLYAAPEQFRNEEVGPSSDLYSLGVLLYELATGANPFRRDAAAQVIAAHLNDTPRTATEVGAELSPFFSEVLTTLLAKTPEGRFTSAEALREVLEKGEKSSWWAEREREILKTRGHLPKVPVRRETELYGRETELLVLREAWNRAQQGQGNTILLKGEAGIGKSRLVDTFLKELEGQEVHVLYGSYPPSGGMGGLSDAVTDHFGMAGLEEALRPYLTVTPSLVPAFAALVKHESPPTGYEPIQGDALHTVMVHLMRGLAEERPLLWVIDDLHFSEPESRKLVLSLAGAVEGHRVLLLTTTRPGLPEDDQAHFSRLENFRRVNLERLFPRDVIQLLRDAFKSEMLAERLGGKIAYKSDGVPFFVFEMIRGLREGQLIKEMPDGTWVETQVVEEIEVPSAVKDLIEARLRDLSDDDRSLLDVGAVQGFEFNPLLTATVRGMKPVAVLERLAVIERNSGVVRGGAGCRFDHHQIQEVVYEGLMPDLRREYHSLLAEAHAERIEGEPTGEESVLLASHHMRGSRPKEGLLYLISALKHLEEGYRNEAAIEFASLALEKPGLLEGKERVEVLLKKNVCLNLLGRRVEQESVLAEAVASADAAGEKPLTARVEGALGNVFLAIGRHEDAKEHYEKLLAIARETGDRRGEATATGGLGNVFHAIGRHEDAEEHYEKWLAIARETGDRRGEATATGNLGLVFDCRGRSKEAREYYERSLAIAREIGYRLGETRATDYLGRALLSLGRYEQAKEHFERCLAIAREIGYRLGEGDAMGSLGSVFSALGRYEDATAHQERRLAIARETGDRWGEALATVSLAFAVLPLGRFGEARSHAERSLALAREIGDRRIEGYGLFVLASLTKCEGNQAEALRLLDESLALRRELGAKDPIAETLVAVARIETELGETESARNALEEALALALETGTPGTILSATVERARLPDGNVREAVAAFEEHADRVDHNPRTEARLRLWQVTQDRAHLEEAHRLLQIAVEFSPEDCRETMITNVPLHRDIMAAWVEHGGEKESPRGS